MTLYVAIDLGCMECGEFTAILGIFDRREDADAVCAEHKQRFQNKWGRGGGEHEWIVFEVEDKNISLFRDYDDDREHIPGESYAWKTAPKTVDG